MLTVSYKCWWTPTQTQQNSLIHQCLNGQQYICLVCLFTSVIHSVTSLSQCFVNPLLGILICKCYILHSLLHLTWSDLSAFVSHENSMVVFTMNTWRLFLTSGCLVFWIILKVYPDILIYVRPNSEVANKVEYWGILQNAINIKYLINQVPTLILPNRLA